MSCRKGYQLFIREANVSGILWRPATRNQSTAASIAVRGKLENELAGIKKAGTWKNERIITSQQDVAIKVQGSEKSILNFCANNYLGLSNHPKVVQAGIDALKSHGAGLSSVRFICGTQDIHKELEDKISRFHERDDTILYASCFDANAGLFEQLCGPQDVILSDELNHASIIDGIRLCKAKKYRYKHKDMKDLEAKLAESETDGIRLIVTDGVFSMDGNVCPLPQIKELADKYGALIFLDECHATGFLGPTGRGTEQLFGMEGSVDIINSTLGKALGGAAGGYTTGPKPLIDLLRQRSRNHHTKFEINRKILTYLNEKCGSIAVHGKILLVFTMLMEDSSFVKRIISNTERFRSKMTGAGFTISGDNHPISPVMLGDAKLASDFADAMLQEGIYVIGFSYPVVPKGKARIRVQISSAHTEEDIDRTVDAFIRVGKNLGVI